MKSVNWLIWCVFCRMTISLNILCDFGSLKNILCYFFPLRKTRPMSALIKRSPIFQPPFLMLEYFYGNMGNTGQCSISISWCQVLEGDDWNRLTVYIGRDLWTWYGLSTATRKADFKSRSPRVLLIFTTRRQQCGPLCLFSGQHICTEICFNHV